MSPEGSPRASVIVRTRNRPRMLARALADIAAQSVDDCEVLVVDEGDDPADARSVVADSALGDRARILDRTTEEHGRWRAANAGVEAARGEFICLHDDDDLWEPDFLEATIAHLDARPASVAVSARTDVIVEREDDGVAVTERSFAFLPEMTAITIPDMLRGNRVVPISLLYRRSLHEELGLYASDLLVLEDWEFYLRVILRHPIDLLDGPIRAHWSHRPDSDGDAGNSIVALEPLHRATDDRIRDAFIRSGIAQDGPGPYVHLAREMQWLDRRLDALQKQAGETNAREESRLQDGTDHLRALGDRFSALEETLAAMRADVADLRAGAEAKTGVRRVWDRLTRRRPTPPAS